MTATFPLTPNWKSPVKEVLTFSTEIITSESGKEQRRAYRNTPRRSFDYSISTMASRYATLKLFLARHSRGQVYLPDPVRSVRMASGISAGGVTFTVTSVPDWLVNGAPVAFSRNGAAETRIVQSVVGTTITVTAGVEFDWSPTSTRIRPAFLGLLDTRFSGKTVTNTTTEGAVKFEVDPGSEGAIAVSAAPVAFGGREFVVTRPNWRTAPSVTYEQPRETVDFGMGKIASFWPIEFMTRVRQADFLFGSAAEAQAFKDVFMRAKGRQGEFYFPTQEADLEPIGLVASGATTFSVAGVNFAEAFGDSTVHKAIVARKTGGQQAAAKVLSIVATGGESVVTLGSPLGFDANTANCTFSWLPVHRFAADELTMTWITNEVAQTSCSLMTLEDLA